MHIESSHRVDSARTVQPFLHDDSANENAAVYHNMNVGKLSLSLNLGCAEGRAVLDDLVGWADVLIESFSPRGRVALGLDYDRLAAINPRLVMMSSCLFGQDGPLAAYAGFGNMAAALTGFFELTGWPDRARPVRSAPTPTTSRHGSRSRRSCRPRRAAEPAAASTSTSPRPRRPSTSSRRRCSTRRLTAG